MKLNKKDRSKIVEIKEIRCIIWMDKNERNGKCFFFHLFEQQEEE